MDRFRAMTVFLAVADEQGFAPAARRLGLSTSAVSRHIAELEAHLSTPLLNRTTRRVRLTEAGAAFRPRARRVLEDLSTLEDDIGADARAPRGRLRITAAPTFGDYLLAPCAARFLLAYPEISLAMDFTDRVVDIVGEGYDAGLRSGPLRDSSLKSRRVAEIDYALCASPGYLARAEPIERPEDLERHPCIHWARGEDGVRWTLRGPDGRDHSIRVAGRFTTSTPLSEQAGALAGLGVAMLARGPADAAFAAGALVEVLPSFRPASWPVTIVWPSAIAAPRKLRVFIDFLAEDLHKTLAPPMREAGDSAGREGRDAP